MSEPSQAAETPPDESPANPLLFPDEPPRRKWPKRLAIAVVLLAIAVTALPAILSTGWTRDLIHAWLEQNVDRHVTFEDLDVTWMNGIVLTNLAVADDASSAVPFLTVPRVHIDAPLLPLLNKQILVEDFTFEDPVVNLALKGGTSTNAQGVFKRKKGKKKGRRKTGKPAVGDEPELEEELVLPDISVPVDVRNLTLILRDPAGGQALQTGITFRGHLTTRGGPTTFDMNVPTGGGKGLRLHGTARLFGDEGALLAVADREIDAKLEIDRLDAQDHRELIALFLPDLLMAGVLDGNVEAFHKGGHASGKLDLRLLDVAVGADRRQGAERGHEDLALTGAFAYGPDGLELSGLEAKAEGLDASADLKGDWSRLTGVGSIDADLGRMATALAALGVELPGEIAGKITGTMEFAGEGARGAGRLVLSDFRSAKWIEGREPVALEKAELAFEVVPDKERFRLEQIVLSLPDLTARAVGERSKDGSVTLDADIEGDLGGLLARARDLGLLPGGFAVNGKVAGKVHVARAAGAAGVTVRTPGIVLTEDDARIVVEGGRDAAGKLDFEVRGQGDLGKLLARATEAGGAPDAAAGVRGTFDLIARAAGTTDAPVLDLERLRLDGDVVVDASGRLGEDGVLSGKLQADGTLAGIEDLLTRVGLIEEPLGLTGNLTARAGVAGTRDEPLVQDLRVQVTEGPIRATLIGGLGAGKTIQGVLDVKGPLDELARLAQVRGVLDRSWEPGGTFSFTAAAKGTLDAPEVPTAKLTIDGPLTITVDGRMDAQKRIRATFESRASLDSLAKVQRQFDPLEEGESRSLPAGTLTVRGDAVSTPDGNSVRIEEFAVQSGIFRIQGNGERDEAGKTNGSLVAKGAVADALALFQAFGWSDGWDGDGSVEFRLDGAVADGVLQGSTSLTGDLTLVERGEDGKTYREPALGVSVPAFRYHVEQKRLEPTAVRLTAEGGRVETRVSFEQIDDAVRKVSVADGTLALDNTFARRHGEHLGGVGFDRLGGTFAFDGTLTANEGTEGAEEWTGTLVLDGSRIVAPYVTATTADARAVIADGALALEKLEAAVNGGTFAATGSFGLVGKQAPHQLTFRATDVGLDAELAPLLARISPLLATGETGGAEGRFSAHGDLTSLGLKGQRIKRRMAGQGELTLNAIKVDSSTWVGQVLDYVGLGGPLEFGSATIPWEIKEGQVVTGMLPIATSALDLRLSGQAGLDGELEYVLGIKPTGRGKSGAFDRLEGLLDDEGFLPLRLEGDITSPKVKLPSAKDLLGGSGKDKLKDLWDRLRGDKDKDDKKDGDGEPKKKKNPKKGKKGDDPPPPPPEGDPPPPPPPEDE